MRRGQLDAAWTRGNTRAQPAVGGQREDLNRGRTCGARFLRFVIGLKQVIVDREAGHSRRIVQAQPVHHLEAMLFDGLDASPKISGNLFKNA